MSGSTIYLSSFPSFLLSSPPPPLLLPCGLQAYCAEMVCFDYHQLCKGNSSKLESVLLPMVADFITSHGFFVQLEGSIQRWVCVCVCVCVLWCECHVILQSVM